MQLIADILSFNTNQEVLSKQFKHTSVDWDAIVIIGSKHLMLPALYCRLKAKSLLDLIPEDLSVYLKEITQINRGRNEILLAEAHGIAEIFNKAHIEHVFIKGIALIAGQTFKDLAERMIGDIDILIAPHQIQKAFDLLTAHGYSDLICSNYERKNFRHLARQVSKQKFGAIELHSEILSLKYAHLLDTDTFLKRKQIVDGIAIPSNEDAIKTAILALQINDKAHLLGYLSFKTIYDCLALNLPSNHLLLAELRNKKHSQSFLNISSVFFEELRLNQSFKYSTLSMRYFILRLNHPKFGHFVYTLLNEYIKLNLRLTLLFSNKSYRQHIIKNKILKTNTVR